APDPGLDRPGGVRWVLRGARRPARGGRGDRPRRPCGDHLGDAVPRPGRRRAQPAGGARRRRGRRPRPLHPRGPHPALLPARRRRRRPVGRHRGPHQPGGPMSSTPSADARRDEVAAGLARVRERIATACAAADRRPEEVTLTVVTKYFPPSDVARLADLGVTDVGENKHQEAADKRPEVPQPLRWHFIGGLQSNKAAAVTRWADVVESVDRIKLVGRLAGGAAEREAPLDVLVQVSLDPPGAAGRAGAAPADVPALAEAIATAGTLRLRGVMGVAPLGEDPAAAFARLADVAAEVRRDHPDATWVSAGMSGDLEQAIAAGATHVRVGSAVLGPRPVIK